MAPQFCDACNGQKIKAGDLGGETGTGVQSLVQVQNRGEADEESESSQSPKFEGEKTRS